MAVSTVRTERLRLCTDLARRSWDFRCLQRRPPRTSELMGDRSQIDLLVRVRYQNTLPPPPYPPKMLDIPTDLKRYTRPEFTQELANETPLPMVINSECGMPLDLSHFDSLWDGTSAAVGLSARQILGYLLKSVDCRRVECCGRTSDRPARFIHAGRSNGCTRRLRSGGCTQRPLAP